MHSGRNRYLRASSTGEMPGFSILLRFCDINDAVGGRGDGNAPGFLRTLLCVAAGLICFTASATVLSCLDNTLPSVKLSSYEVAVLSVSVTCTTLLVGFECLVNRGVLDRPEAARLVVLARNVRAVVATVTADALAVLRNGVGSVDDGGGGDAAVDDIA